MEQIGVMCVQAKDAGSCQELREGPGPQAREPPEGAGPAHIWLSDFWAPEL